MDLASGRFSDTRLLLPPIFLVRDFSFCMLSLHAITFKLVTGSEFIEFTNKFRVRPRDRNSLCLVKIIKFNGHPINNTSEC